MTKSAGTICTIASPTPNSAPVIYAHDNDQSITHYCAAYIQSRVGLTTGYRESAKYNDNSWQGMIHGFLYSPSCHQEIPTKTSNSRNLRTITARKISHALDRKTQTGSHYVMANQRPGTAIRSPAHAQTGDFRIRSIAIHVNDIHQ